MSEGRRGQLPQVEEGNKWVFKLEAFLLNYGRKGEKILKKTR